MFTSFNAKSVGSSGSRVKHQTSGSFVLPFGGTCSTSREAIVVAMAMKSYYELTVDGEVATT